MRHHDSLFVFQYVIRDRVLLMKSSVVIILVIILFFIHSFVHGLDLNVGMLLGFPLRSFNLQWLRYFCPGIWLPLDLQSWTKVLGTVPQYSYFPVISRFLLKTVHHFRNFLALLLLPTLDKVETRKNSRYTRPTLFVGGGEGLDLFDWENATETLKVPRLLSMTRFVTIPRISFT